VGFTSGTITFDAVMDTSVLPDVDNFELKLASVIRVIDNVSWDSPTVLRFESVAGIPAVAPVTMSLLWGDTNLHQLAGEIVLPFGPVTIPEL